MPPTLLQPVVTLDDLPTAVQLTPALDMAIITTHTVVVAPVVMAMVLVALEMVVVSLATTVMAQVGEAVEAAVMVEVVDMRGLLQVLGSPHAEQNGSTNLT